MATQIICDCCRKPTGESYLRLVLPIIKTDHMIGLVEKEMDICQACCNKFSRLYYQIAEEHGSTGIMGISVEVDDG